MIASAQMADDRKREIQIIVALLEEADNTNDLEAVRRLTHAARLHLVDGFRGTEAGGTHG